MNTFLSSDYYREVIQARLMAVVRLFDRISEVSSVLFRRGLFCFPNLYEFIFLCQKRGMFYPANAYVRVNDRWQCPDAPPRRGNKARPNRDDSSFARLHLGHPARAGLDRKEFLS